MKTTVVSPVLGTALFLASALALQSNVATTACAGEYFPGKVVFAFKAGHMPNQASVDLPNRRFSIPQLDAIIEARQGTRLTKLRPEYLDEYRSEAGAILGRTFVLEYKDGTDPAVFVSELSALPYFQFVEVNPRLEVVFFGTQRYIPSDSHFPQQWNLDSSVDDREDIDAPEAWMIERGDPNLIIGIIDSGTMIDTFQTPWELHPDFNRYFNLAEDFPPTMALTFADVDQNDNTPSADPDNVADNVIGRNWQKEPFYPTNPLDLAFWQSQPINTRISPVNGNPWRLLTYDTHGLNVESIAAARAGDPLGVPSTVGVANQCMVYHVRIRSDDPLSDPLIQIDVLEHAALYADVINMSWGFFTNPGSPFALATQQIAEADDVVLVASVGNISQGATEVVWPARYPWVLGVGNMAHDLNRFYDSTFGPQVGFVDVVAPIDHGVPVNSHGDPTCGFLVQPIIPCDQSPVIRLLFNGTSAASPTAAGIAALLRSRFPSLTQDQVRDRIIRSAEKYWPDTEQNRLELGDGKINAYRSLTEWGSVHPAPVGTNVTWSANAASGGIYSKDGIFYLSGDLTIDLGDTLTINKGVTIKVAPDHEGSGGDPSRVQIVVKGTLRTGTAGTGPIVFQSFTGTATRSDWVGIKFESTSTNNVLNGVTIKNAQVGIENHAPVTLTSCVVQECVRGIEVDTAITIQACTIEACDISGVDISSVGIVGQDSAYIDGTTIRNVGGKGINLRDKGKLRLTNSTIDNAGNGIEVHSGAKLYASGNTLFQNNYIGVRIYAGTPAVPPATAQLVFCDIKNNNTGIEAEGISGVTVKSCLISGNTVQGVSCKSGAAIELRTNNIKNSPVGIFCDNSAPKIRKGNTIKLNSTGIKCVNFSNAVVESTTIDSNGKGVTALTGSNPELGRETVNPPPPSKGYNAIENDTTYSVGNYTSIWIKAEKNYWGPGGPYPSSRFVGLVDRFPFLPGKPENGPPPYEDPGEAPVFQPSDEVPMVYGISNGYPNPFNPATRLNYEVPRPGGHVLITVFNVKGQRVATLADKYQAPGFYTAAWDGKSDGGTDVATGVYFVQMQAPNFTKTRKLVLLK